MNKKKLFSVISTGVIIFSTGVPSALALDIHEMNGIGEDKLENMELGLKLSEIVVIENEELNELFKYFYLTQDNESFLLRSPGAPHELSIRVDESEEMIVSKDESFTYSFPIINKDLDKDVTLYIDVSLEGNQIETIELPVNDLTSIFNGVDPAEELDEIEVQIEEKEVSKHDESLDVTDETVSDEGQEKFETLEDIDDISMQPEEVKEISQEVYPDYEDEKQSNDISLDRSTEVEELLHGVKSETASMNVMTRSTFTVFNTRVHDNGIYTVVAGDTFNAIAQSFNLSLIQLREWNGHVTNINQLSIGTKLAVTRRGVETMLSSSDKNRLYQGGTKPVFTTNQEFINHIAPRAVAIANQKDEEGLWASLMIAQAAHESAYGRSALSSPPYYNLSGLKGSHNGNSVLMWTWEVIQGVRVDVLAGFRRFSSYDESLQSYANLLRRGNWDKNYYNGTWRSNTSSVWEVLDNGGLRGYATDPNYFAAIRRIINQYDLTQYDNTEASTQPVENIANTRPVSFVGVVKNGYSIDTHPWGTKGFQRIALTKDYMNQRVNVVKVTQNGAYSLVEQNGILIGWVDSRAIDNVVKKISNGINISYEVIIESGGYSIDSLPWGTKGYINIGNTSMYRGQKSRVIQRTPNGHYLLLEQDGNLLGWVDHRSVKRPIQIGNVATSYPMAYTATISRSGYSLDSLPWGTQGFQRIDVTNSYVGRAVEVTHEAGAYALVRLNGIDLGWIDKSALSHVPVWADYSAASIVNYTAKLRAGYSIDTLPWGVNGFKRISTTTLYAGEAVRVVRQTGSYALIQIRGRNIGWVDRKAIIR